MNIRPTPAPWEIEIHPDSTATVMAAGKPLFLISKYNGRLPEVIGNRLLVVAAPELYDAGKAVLRHPHVQAYLPYDPADPVFRSLLSAVAKAEGRMS